MIKLQVADSVTNMVDSEWKSWLTVPLQEVSQLQADKNLSEEHLNVGHKFQMDFVLLSSVNVMHSLLEPDPAKHAGKEREMRSKWLDEGATQNEVKLQRKAKAGKHCLESYPPMKGKEDDEIRKQHTGISKEAATEPNV
ncbi:Hormonally up-regulated neu tumor-associated kinase [Manis javanica]|nr:Hormonally up-regulated neu tumor-associated kinase [Manis javanica]